MGLSLKYLKEKMARNGYYLASDYAKLVGISRQAVHIKVIEDSLPVIKDKGRNWVKYDNGEHAISVYGPPKNPLQPFLNFGFTHRLKSLLIGDKVVMDIKYLRENECGIRFYNQNGDMLHITADLKSIEIIDDVPDSK